MTSGGCPSYIEAISDIALVGYPRYVYDQLYYFELDPVEFRPIKQMALASQLQCSLHSIQRAIATLIRLKYIERGPIRPGEVRTYRLVHRRTR